MFFKINAKLTTETVFKEIQLPHLSWWSLGLHILSPSDNALNASGASDSLITKKVSSLQSIK